MGSRSVIPSRSARLGVLNKLNRGELNKLNILGVLNKLNRGC